MIPTIPLWAFPIVWGVLMYAAAYVEWRVNQRRARLAYEARRMGRRDVIDWMQS